MTVALCYVTQIKEVGVIDKLSMTMKAHERSVDLGYVNTPITTEYVTITLESWLTTLPIGTQHPLAVAHRADIIRSTLSVLLDTVTVRCCVGIDSRDTR